jgi:hypothetical protein
MPDCRTEFKTARLIVRLIDLSRVGDVTHDGGERAVVN